MTPPFSTRMLICGLLLVVVHACSRDRRPAHAAGGGGVPASPSAGAGAGDVAGGDRGVAAKAGSGSQESGGDGSRGGEGGLAGAAPRSTGGSAGLRPIEEGGEAGSGGPTQGCQNDPVLAPSAGACVQVGSAGYECNPVTGAPCEGWSNETCEFDGAAFRCWEGEARAACRSCDIYSASCELGFTCRGTLGRCTRYCCDDGDCAPTTRCVVQPPTALGICQAVTSQALGNFLWNTPLAGAGGAGAGGAHAAGTASEGTGADADAPGGEKG